jgi:type IV pilus assembly protein PilF
MRYWLHTQALLITAAVLVVTGCASQEPRVEAQGNEKEAAGINAQLGVAHLEQGNLQTASVKLEHALRQDPELATTHWSYALLQMRLGRPKLAESHFHRAVELDPADSLAHNNPGTILCNAGRLSEAQTQFGLALRNPLYDQPETALTNAGVCALKAADR